MNVTFQVGDRVECVKSGFGVEVGELGEVRYITDDGVMAVNWDKRGPLRHDCVGYCDDGHGLWFYHTKVQFYTPNEDIGDVSSSELMSLLF